MSTDWLPDPPAPLDWLGRSFMTTALLPAAAPVGAIALLFASHAWSGTPHWREGVVALERGGWSLGGRLLAMAIVLGLMLNLMSPTITRFFEGEWGGGALASCMSVIAVERHRRAYEHLEGIVYSAAPQPLGADAAKSPTAVHRHEASLDALGWFPSKKADCLPTVLGNAHSRAVLEAGAPYGLGGRAALVPIRIVAQERDCELLDQARLRLDVAIRLTAMLLVTTALSAVWLWRAGGWLLLALVPYALAALVYRAAVALAVEYGSVVNAVLLVNRRELYRRIGVPSYGSLEEERTNNKELMLAIDPRRKSSERASAILGLRTDTTSEPEPAG